MLKSKISFISRCTYKIIEAQKFEAQYLTKIKPSNQNINPRKSKFLKFFKDQPKITNNTNKTKTKAKANAKATPSETTEATTKEKNKVMTFLGKPFEFNRSRYIEISKENQIQLFFRALKHCGGSSISDIYKISYREFTNSPEGQSIFYFFGGSMVRMCYTLFPDFEWAPWLFKKNSDLSKMRREKDYDYSREIKWFAAKHNIKDSNLDDWYKMKLTDLLKECKIRNLFSIGLVDFIRKAYPHHKFYLFKFHKIILWWKYPDGLDDFRQYLLKETQFTSMEQFYLLSKTKFTSLGGTSLLLYYKYDLHQIYSILFPDYPWNKELLTPEAFQQLTNPKFEKIEPISKNFDFPKFKKKKSKFKYETFAPTQIETQQELLNKINENLK
ncbi:hypothetical protein DDB_G0287949 [Dictyostelium discoideum AX4]|uniref:Uncharacterized protein n=1 Tax=Dictyostelium discoideum TaxID=44689 RepID=Q54JM7_DICDI|nr:hypothetical protein DDB_G0287949 [Dictyostelium discoideum AX4]EAL63466.1 hypothetical protein DDB_G0287949 [Dictyostelium discoideum AX4]|eukprot:XP_636970.1 hypothetical protein DDB_G0287949 [Dictyostelium discoideum AX4]